MPNDIIINLNALFHPAPYPLLSIIQALTYLMRENSPGQTFSKCRLSYLCWLQLTANLCQLSICPFNSCAGAFATSLPIPAMIELLHRGQSPFHIGNLQPISYASFSPLLSSVQARSRMSSHHRHPQTLTTWLKSMISSAWAECGLGIRKWLHLSNTKSCMANKLIKKIPDMSNPRAVTESI